MAGVPKVPVWRVPNDPGRTGERQAAAQGLKPQKLNADKISFSTRSFEGMIYYLGEAVRHEDDPPSYADQLFPMCWVAIRPWPARYVETMFYASSGMPDADTAVHVRDDSGKTYGLPKYCMADDFSKGTTRSPVRRNIPTMKAWTF